MTTINVTQDQITLGSKGNCQFCPIALAIKQVLNEEYYPHVVSSHVKFKLTNTGEEVTYLNLPESAMLFIMDFDAPQHPFATKPQPFSFQLDIPKYMLRSS